MLFDGLGMVEEILSDTEIKVYALRDKKSYIIKATKEYVSSIKAELEEDAGIIIPFNKESLIAKEDVN